MTVGEAEWRVTGLPCDVALPMLNKGSFLPPAALSMLAGDDGSCSAIQLESGGQQEGKHFRDT